jgi:hypothetical protein
MQILNLNYGEIKLQKTTQKRNMYASGSNIPLKDKSPSLSSSGITNLRWPEDDTAWGRNGWKEKPLTVSAQQTEQKKANYIYENGKQVHIIYCQLAGQWSLTQYRILQKLIS